ncbi:MAG: NrdH-redoxin [Bacteroidetes bacterium]|nr:MAG: NrdH-redoxin [Bacteroidota bacterium]
MKKIIMYGTPWCADCNRSKAILEDFGLEYEYIDIDKDEDAAQKVMKVNQGRRVVPTLIIDGKAHSNPDYLELKELLEGLEGNGNN